MWRTGGGKYLVLKHECLNHTESGTVLCWLDQWIVSSWPFFGFLKEIFVEKIYYPLFNYLLSNRSFRDIGLRSVCEETENELVERNVSSFVIPLYDAKDRACHWVFVLCCILWNTWQHLKNLFGVSIVCAVTNPKSIINQFLGSWLIMVFPFYEKPE